MVDLSCTAVAVRQHHIVDHLIDIFVQIESEKQFDQKFAEFAFNHRLSANIRNPARNSQDCYERQERE